MTKPIKVAVCVPSGAEVSAAFATCLALLVASSAVPLVLLNAESSLVPVNRNNLVAGARQAGASHVLFLDADMTFPPDALERLLAHGLDIVGTVYPRRVPPNSLVGNLMGESATSPQEAFELGLGCILINCRVFDRLTAPYFRLPAIESPNQIPKELEGFDLSGYEPPCLMGEDYYFCKSARRAGFSIWADTALSMELGHIGTVVYRIPGKGV